MAQALAPKQPQSEQNPQVTVRNPQDALMRTKCGESFINAEGEVEVCSSMMLLALPWSHCPKCHHLARIKKLTMPLRCLKCGFNLMKWRVTQGVYEQAPVDPLRLAAQDRVA